MMKLYFIENYISQHAFIYCTGLTHIGMDRLFLGTIDIHYKLIRNAKSKPRWSCDRKCATPTENIVLIIGH